MVEIFKSLGSLNGTHVVQSEKMTTPYVLVKGEDLKSIFDAIYNIKKIANGEAIGLQKDVNELHKKFNDIFEAYLKVLDDYKINLPFELEENEER